MVSLNTTFKKITSLLVYFTLYTEKNVQSEYFQQSVWLKTLLRFVLVETKTKFLFQKKTACLVFATRMFRIHKDDFIQFIFKAWIDLNLITAYHSFACGYLQIYFLFSSHSSWWLQYLVWNQVMGIIGGWDILGRIADDQNCTVNYEMIS